MDEIKEKLSTAIPKDDFDGCYEIEKETLTWVYKLKKKNTIRSQL